MRIKEQGTHLTLNKHDDDDDDDNDDDDDDDKISRGFNFDSRQVPKIFLSSKTSRPVPRHFQPPIHCVPGAISPSVKLLKSEVGHLPTHSIEFSNKWLCASWRPYAFMEYTIMHEMVFFRRVTSFNESVQRLATGWMVRRSNSDGGEIFRARPDRPWGPLNLLYNGYRLSFPGIKRPERDVDHPPQI